MRHRVKKIKFYHGRDANRMLVRKLATNFFIHAKLETTLNKAKVMKSVVERLVEKAKSRSEANKNYLLKVLNDKALVEQIFKDAGSNLQNKTGGYVRVVKLGIQRADGSELARLEWTIPIVVEKKPLAPTKSVKISNKSIPARPVEKKVKQASSKK